MMILNIERALNGLEQPFILLKIINNITQGISIPTTTTYNLYGVIQPLDLRKLGITPIEQKAFGTHMVHIRQSLLEQNQIIFTENQSTSLTYMIVKNKASYKVVGKWLYNDYGYVEVNAIQVSA